MSSLNINTEQLKVLVNKINEIPDIILDLPELNNEGTASDLLEEKHLIDSNCKLVVGTISINNESDLETDDEAVVIPMGYYANQAVKSIKSEYQATPNVSINQSNGLITATATQTAGYVAAGSKSGTLQLAFQPAQTITPSVANKTIAANTYLGGIQTIKGDANLAPENIKQGVSIFDIEGIVNEAGAPIMEKVEHSENEQKLIEDKSSLKEYYNNRLESIRNNAFAFCSNLISVNFSNCIDIGADAFRFCSNLTTISFPNCITIGSNAFSACINLTSVNFPNCTTIGSYVFSRCTNLTMIGLPKCSIIGSGAFADCNSLTSVNFSKCATIDMSAFQGCTNLTTADFPECTTIGKSAFQRCIKLTSVNFPECTSINTYAFSGCQGLISVNFPKCTDINNTAFSGCSNLVSVNFPECTAIHGDAFTSCINLTTVEFPKCRTIYWRIFNGCIKLTSVTLPACTAVSNSAFYGCTNLKSVDLPAGAYISSGAFVGCINLETAWLQSSYTSSVYAYIGSYAFSGCYKLSELYLLNPSVCYLSASNAFTSTPFAGYSSYFSGTPHIYVPASLIDRYKSATNWTYFADKIIPFGLGDINFSSISTGRTKNMAIQVNGLDGALENVTITLQDSEYATVSNIQSNVGNISFDVTTFDKEGKTELFISGIDKDGCNYERTYLLMITHPIGDFDTLFKLDTTTTVSIPFDTEEILPDNVSIISSDENILSISNIQYTSENITCDMTTYNISGNVDIDIAIVHNGRTYNKTITIKGLGKSYTIEDLGTTYGFTLNNAGYYESTNKGTGNSFAICKLNIVAPSEVTLYLDCINSAENNYDYGLLSTLDKTLEVNHFADTANIHKSFKGSSSTDIQTVSYTIPAGEHFIYIKYIKNYMTSSGNDSLQFKVRFE